MLAKVEAELALSERLLRVKSRHRLSELERPLCATSRNSQYERG
jgi:hypothetical protein